MSHRTGKLYKRRYQTCEASGSQRATNEHPEQSSGISRAVDLSDITRVVDDDNHGMHHIFKESGDGLDTTFSYQLRGAWKNVMSHYKKLSKYSNVKSKIDKSGWSRLLELDMPNSQKHIIEAMIERWWDTTHTFHFPHAELGFTPEDFTFLTGIAIGHGKPPVYDDKYKNSAIATCEKYFCYLGLTEYRYGGIAIKTLNDYLNDSRWPEILKDSGLDPLLEDGIARAFLMYVLGNLFFSNPSSIIHIGWLESLVDFDKVGSYDWGGAILNYLYLSLDNCSRRTGRSFDGMWQLLEYWYYEYCGGGPDLIVNGDYWPRLAKWASNQRKRRGNHSVNGRGGIHDHIETCDICFTPWASSRFYNEPIVVHARLLSSQRVILWDPFHEMGMRYLGDRCWRQVTGFVAVATNPPSSMMLKMIDKTYDEVRSCGWKDASGHIRRVCEAQWRNYWRHVSVGPIMHGKNASSAISRVPPSSVPSSSVPLSCVPPSVAPFNFDREATNYYDTGLISQRTTFPSDEYGMNPYGDLPRMPPMNRPDSYGSISTIPSPAGFTPWCVNIRQSDGSIGCKFLAPGPERVIPAPPRDAYDIDQWRALALERDDLARQMNIAILYETSRLQNIKISEHQEYYHRLSPQVSQAPETQQDDSRVSET